MNLSVVWKIAVVTEKFLPNVSSDYVSSPNKSVIVFDKSGVLITSGAELHDSDTYTLSHPDLGGHFILELTVMGKSFDR